MCVNADFCFVFIIQSLVLCAPLPFRLEVYTVVEVYSVVEVKGVRVRCCANQKAPQITPEGYEKAFRR